MTNLFQSDAVRIGPIILIPDILKQFDVEAEEVLAEAGLSADLFEDPDNLISFSARTRLVELCRQKTRCDHFGLLLGSKVDLTFFGLIGYLALNSASVGLALRNVVRYFHLHSLGSILTLEVKDDCAFFGYNIYRSNSEAISQIEDAAVVIIHNTLQSLCGEDWSPTEICFAHRVPGDLEPYRHFFKSRLRFDAEYSGVFFHSKWLTQNVDSADPKLFRILQKQVEQLESRYASDFPAQVKRLVIAALPLGKANVDQIAALFSLHVRTFNRKLNEHSTCFRVLAEDARFELSRQLLRSTDMGICEIAEILGYSDASAFTKAFKRWSNVTPTKWRADCE